MYRYIHTCIYICISQRTISGINSQKPFILFFIKFFFMILRLLLTWNPVTLLGYLTSKPQDLTVYACSGLGLQVPTIKPGFLKWFQRVKPRFECLLSKHFSHGVISLAHTCIFLVHLSDSTKVYEDQDHPHCPGFFKEMEIWHFNHKE